MSTLGDRAAEPYARKDAITISDASSAVSTWLPAAPVAPTTATSNAELLIAGTYPGKWQVWGAGSSA
ncbi:MAG: hypothetical protein Q8P41_23790 [Pseudomonadota bacterium]|nr:hypothetical protein [Pseudomonadota bacterium]